MRRAQYDKIETYMQACMEDSAHDREHVYRVLYNALEIAGDDPEVDFEVLTAASLLHDIGRKEQFADPQVCHARVGAQKAFGFLQTLGWENSQAEHAADCIRTHSYRKSDPPASVEAKILFDADKLDVTGALGIARTLLYKGGVAEPLYSIDDEGRILDGSGNEPKSFFQEYKFKLEGIYDAFYTEKGKQLARERQQSAIFVYERILKEANCGREKGKKQLYRLFDPE